MLARPSLTVRARAVVSSLVVAGGLLVSGEASAQKAFVNFGVGPTIFLQGGTTQLHVELEAGLSIARHLYVVFVPSGSFGHGFTVVTLPLGLEYDIPIRGVPRLYVYPRLLLGAGLFFDNISQATFAVQPGLGIKYAIAGVWNLGIEPIDFPIYVADSPGFPTSAYRFSAITGFNF